MGPLVVQLFECVHVSEEQRKWPSCLQPLRNRGLERAGVREPGQDVPFGEDLKLLQHQTVRSSEPAEHEADRDERDGADRRAHCKDVGRRDRRIEHHRRCVQPGRGESASAPISGPVAIGVVAIEG